MKSGVVVLCTNYDFLEAMLKNYPEELSENPLVVVVEDRIERSPSLGQVEELCKKYEIQKHKVIGAKKIVKWFKKETGMNNDFIDNYTMGMNILVQPYLLSQSKMPAILFIDDDVILSEGIAEVMTMKKSAFKYYRLSAGPTNYEDLKGELKNSYDELASITRFTGTYADYIKAHISSGNRFLTKKQFAYDYYMSCLKRFFSNKSLEEKWDRYKETGKGKMAAFFLDEKFETMVFFTMGILEFGIEKLVQLETAKPEKLGKGKLIKRPIWHNATVSNKYRTLEILRERKEIK